MVSERAYKPGRSIEEALEELRRCRGTQFDPDIVDAFARSLENTEELEPQVDFKEPLIN
jgi:HD-GYP domain-containing protein (c-di-GMP phosphodiesterase class II)